MHGILLIDKPDGITSAEVVRRVKRQVKVKVGHLGTLDPFATGLLPLCLGEATKIAQFLNTADKRYEGIIALGAATDTGDRTGTTVRTAEVPDLSTVDLAELTRRFSGELLQTPPMYSAVKRDGVPLYRLARRGVAVERTARPVRIDDLVLEPAGPTRLRFALGCSKGTYIRVLAEDIGAALGSAAHLHDLRRTAFGSFGIADAAPLDTWDPAGRAGFITLRQAVAHLPAVPLDERVAEAARQGKTWVLRTIDPDLGEAAALVDQRDEVVAIVVSRQRQWTYGRVFAEGQLYIDEALC